MAYQGSIGTIALSTLLLTTISGALAFDETKYPDLAGQWHQASPPQWVRPGEKAPLTLEYQAIFQANLAEQAAGGPGDVPSWYCLPQGMPRMMNAYDPMEIVVTPAITYILISHVNDSYRRIYTDGRDWPEEVEPSYAGYSIGKWIDEDRTGKYGALVIETRHLKGPRSFDATGLLLHKDDQTIIKERLYLDEADRNILHDEITVIDHALTRPWTLTKNYRHEPKLQPVWRTAACAENNDMVRIGKDAYFLSADGFLMPTKKNQPPPDTRYFKQTQR